MTKYLGLFLFFLASLCSCVDDVVFGSVGDRVVVVNCILKYPAQEQSLYLATASAVGSSSTGHPVKDASVTIQDITESGASPVSFVYKEGLEYTAQYGVVPGHRYHLNIEIKGRKPIFSETEVPQASEIQVSYNSPSHGLDSHVVPPTYLYNIKELFGRPFWLYAMDYVPSLNDWKIVEEIGGAYKGLCHFGYVAVDKFNIIGETTSFQTRFTEHFQEIFYMYDYYVRFTGEQENLEEMRKEFDGRLVLYNDIIFVSGDFDGEYYTTPKEETVTIYPDKESPEGGKGVVVISVPSENFDFFMKELCIYREKHENMKDLTALYEKTDLYSNMSAGAKGIFGAQLVYYLPWRPIVESF